MFRCPSCAHVWKLPLTNGYSLLAHQDMNRMWIASEPITMFSTFIPVENDLLDVADKLDKAGLNFDFKRENELECPFCKAVHPFTKWHDAFVRAGDYFESDNLCSCGGELWYDKVPGSPRYALVCEECGWEKPKAVISGHKE